MTLIHLCITQWSSTKLFISTMLNIFISTCLPMILLKFPPLTKTDPAVCNCKTCILSSRGGERMHQLDKAAKPPSFRSGKPSKIGSSGLPAPVRRRRKIRRSGYSSRQKNAEKSLWANAPDGTWCQQALGRPPPSPARAWWHHVLSGTSIS